MTTNVSNLGLQLLSLNNLQSEQVSLAQLTEELGSGQQQSNLTNYSPTTAIDLMNFQNSVTQKQAYLGTIQTVQTRLTIYNQTMGDMENIASQAQSLATTNQNLNASTVGEVQTQVQSYLRQVTDDLNQQVGDRYIYSGTRYSTAPVVDLTTLTGTPTFPFTPTTSPTLPNYDSEYNPPTTTTDSAAFTQDSVTIDDNFSVQYGITSNAPAFQQLVAGLQFMNAATQSGVSAATYQTDMTNASSLLSTALTGIQALNTNVASNQNILTQEATTQNADISSLQGQISNLQHVDVAQVGTEINTLQTQLQASYSATASLEQLSILKYL